MKNFILTNLINFILIAILTICLGWLVASYIDIINNNLEAIPQYADWNLFTIIFG